jgi:DNA-binding NarL/FixJ family response regulator
VLQLVATGLSDADVARRLFVSPRTVHAHLRAIYRKLGVRSRASATRYAVDHHLTT